MIKRKLVFKIIPTLQNKSFESMNPTHKRPHIIQLIYGAAKSWTCCLFSLLSGKSKLSHESRRTWDHITPDIMDISCSSDAIKFKMSQEHLHKTQYCVLKSQNNFNSNTNEMISLKLGHLICVLISVWNVKISSIVSEFSHWTGRSLQQ